MTTGYQKAGTDLDAIFQARVSAARANVNYKSNGAVDLAQRFEPIGLYAPGANVNYQSAGTDLAQLFKNINSGVVLVPSENYTDSTTAAGRNADAGFGITGDGDILRILNFSSLDDADWIAPKSAAPGGGYSVRATIVSGSQSSGDSVGTWFGLTTGTVYQWHVQRLSFSGVGTNTLVLTVEVRASNGNILSTATVTLNAQLT
jgi:hypothetical protein